MVNHLITSQSQTLQSASETQHSTPQKISTPENLPENMRQYVISDPVNSTMSSDRPAPQQLLRGVVTHGQMI